VAPAYNEEATIISNVRSLLNLNYPKWELIVVNDGSKDQTLQKLIDEFDLREIHFAYHQSIPCQPVIAFYKSSSIAYNKLLVISKVNGKSKADAVNAGINAAEYPLLLNTDVDCILDRNTLFYLVQPFIDDDARVIATGATLRSANSSIVESGVIHEQRAPRSLIPLFQELEYTRSYLLGKMGWSLVNAVPNVSGGLGLFDKEILIKSGGYDPKSFGEDIDMVVRMGKFMCDRGEVYAVRHIPETICWTEVPATFKVLARQRVRWGRGLMQLFQNHYGILFDRRYGLLGMVILPYNLFFELLAPLIEFSGLLVYGYLAFKGTLNLSFAFVLLTFTFSFSVFVTTFSIYLDQLVNRSYRTFADVVRLCVVSFLEPFLYHPVNVFLSLKGYLYQLLGKKHQWGNMQRQGFLTRNEL
jgi:cellulose synthase/poly-beta-1,6-N-acetylglucosamine synthase-like glycosyltransferase